MCSTEGFEEKKSFLSPTMGKFASYICRVAKTRPCTFHPARFIIPHTLWIQTKTSKTWHDGKCIICEGCAEKEIQALVTRAPSVAGGTFWLKVNQRIPKELPHFGLLWCLLTDDHMWSLFQQCPTFIHLAMIPAAAAAVVVRVEMECDECGIVTDPGNSVSLHFPYTVF